MSQKLFTRPYRPAWIAVAVVVLLAISMVFAPVRALANSFLGLFRVQQIAVVQVDPGNLPQKLGVSSQFEAMFTQDVKYQMDGQSHTVASVEEASQSAKIAVRLPGVLTDNLTLYVQPGGSATYKVDQERLQALLNEIGRSDIKLPKGLNGATVNLVIPTSVAAEYGDCQFQAKKALQQGNDPDLPASFPLSGCTTLVQMTSPTISAPPGIDLSQVGEAFLQVMGMSRAEAVGFAQRIDWTTTLVIPLPSQNASYQDVQVDGVAGVFIETAKQPVQKYGLIWVKDGVVYALTGSGDITTALQIANSLK